MTDDDHTYKSHFAETSEQFTARMHIVRGEVKLSHAGEKAQLEAQLAAMTAERDEWKRIAQDNARNESRLESVSERLRGDVAKLEAECAAWREMARAERHAAGARLHGNGEQRAEAFRRLGAAEGALRDLGIDPHA